MSLNRRKVLFKKSGLKSGSKKKWTRTIVKKRESKAWSPKEGPENMGSKKMGYKCGPIYVKRKLNQVFTFGFYFSTLQKLFEDRALGHATHIQTGWRDTNYHITFSIHNANFLQAQVGESGIWQTRCSRGCLTNSVVLNFPLHGHSLWDCLAYKPIPLIFYCCC